jgi:hypothetical protein
MPGTTEVPVPVSTRPCSVSTNAAQGIPFARVCSHAPPPRTVHAHRTAAARALDACQGGAAVQVFPSDLRALHVRSPRRLPGGGAACWLESSPPYLSRMRSARAREHAQAEAAEALSSFICIRTYIHTYRETKR